MVLITKCTIQFTQLAIKAQITTKFVCLLSAKVIKRPFQHTVKTLIRLLLKEGQSDLGPHSLCLYLHYSIKIANICSRRLKWPYFQM